MPDQRVAMRIREVIGLTERMPRMTEAEDMNRKDADRVVGSEMELSEQGASTAARLGYASQQLLGARGDARLQRRHRGRRLRNLVLRLCRGEPDAAQYRLSDEASARVCRGSGRSAAGRAPSGARPV